MNAYAEIIARIETDVDTIAQKADIVDRAEATALFTPKSDVIIPNYAFALGVR